MDKVLSNEFLLKELKARLNAKNELQASDIGIYNEFLDRAHRRFKWFGYMTPENLLKIEGMPDYLKAIANKTFKVDSSVKAKNKNSTLVNIEEVLANLEDYPTLQNIAGLSIEDGTGKGNVVIAKILVVHARGYAKKAFQLGMFDMASVNIADMSGILRLAQAIYKGDLKTAYKLNDFDTSVRDQLPNRAYVWMQRNLNG